jgi:hypothetical protein
MNKYKIIQKIFILFLAFLALFVIMYKYFSPLGRGPLTWKEIYNDLPFFLLYSLIAAIIMYFQLPVNKDKENNKK